MRRRPTLSKPRLEEHMTENATDEMQAAPAPLKTLHVRSWGCQMNVYDSQRMVDLLAPLGYRPVAQAEGADMVILNTCHIREKATEKLFSELGRLKITKQEKKAAGGEMILAVA